MKKGYAHTEFTLNKQRYQLEVYRNDNRNEKQPEKEPLIYLLTNRLDAKRIGKQYRERWKADHQLVLGSA